MTSRWQAWSLGSVLILAAYAGMNTAPAAARQSNALSATHVRIEQKHATVNRIGGRVARVGNQYLKRSTPARPQTGRISARELAARKLRHVRARAAAVQQPNLKVITTARATRRTLPLVVLDAGHGGRDPGAIGGLDTLEKTVTLATVQELARQLRATHRYRVAFTREADYFVALNRRVAIARHSGAALLISVHADASVSRRARGASVYVRSAHYPALGAVHLPAHRGASHVIARALIAADTVLPASDPEVARLQLAMVGSLDDDLRMAADPARQARLHVLAALGIPSVLLEIGFISNPQDEVLMRQPAHRRILARAVLDAVDDFFAGRDDTARSRT